MIVDLKTGVKEDWHRLQTAAYDHLDCDEEVTFEPGTHTYYHQGVWIPNVTKILYDTHQVSLYSLHDWPRERGLAVHLACALLPNLDWSTVDQRILPWIISFMRWLELTKFEVTHKEQRGYNRQYGYGGTLDLRGHFPHRRLFRRGALYLQADGSTAHLEIHDNLKDWAEFVQLKKKWRPVYDG